jgi:hypothetical protein
VPHRISLGVEGLQLIFVQEFAKYAGFIDLWVISSPTDKLASTPLLPLGK